MDIGVYIGARVNIKTTTLVLITSSLESLSSSYLKSLRCGYAPRRGGAFSAPSAIPVPALVSVPIGVHLRVQKEKQAFEALPTCSAELNGSPSDEFWVRLIIRKRELKSRSITDIYSLH